MGKSHGNGKEQEQERTVSQETFQQARAAGGSNGRRREKKNEGEERRNMKEKREGKMTGKGTVELEQEEVGEGRSYLKRKK